MDLTFVLSQFRMLEGEDKSRWRTMHIVKSQMVVSLYSGNTGR